jgi:hypothetical protein
MNGVLSGLLVTHTIAIVLIVAFTELIKGAIENTTVITTRDLGIAERWYVAIPFGLGAILAYPISLVLGRPEWYFIVIGAFFDATASATLWKADHSALDIIGWLKRLLGLQ